MILEQEHMACDEKKVDLSSIQSSHYYKYSQKIIVPLHIKWLTKYEACKHLGISRATFDRRVADGENPVVGAIVGAAVDFGAQVVSSIVEGKSLKQSLGDVNWTSVGISAAEGAITSGGSAVKQVVQTTAKHTIVKAASKTAAKKAAATATSTKGVSVVAATGRAVSKTANGDGSFVENLVAEAVGYGAAKGVTKAVNKAIKPKLTTNDAALANKGKGEKGSTVIRNNRSTNQTNLDKSNRNRSIATNVGTTATSWGTAVAQSAVKKDPNCNK